MSGGLLHLAPYLASMHAMLLSTVNLYPGYRDRAPRPGIRARYKYHADLGTYREASLRVSWPRTNQRGRPWRHDVLDPSRYRL